MTSDLDNKKPEGRENPKDPIGAIGRILDDKYEITDYIASGGFADVYKGVNTTLMRQQVVVKFIRKADQVDRLRREVRVLTDLHHPNICQPQDFLEEHRAIVFPYVDGDNCEDLVRVKGPLTIDVFVQTAASLLDSLNFAHSKGVAHRDIKPANIMLSDFGNTFLIDFGIAKQLGTVRTKTGYHALTPQFAAPERHCASPDYNPFLSDVYELGVTLYFLLIGTVPYRDAERPDISEWGTKGVSRLSRAAIKFLKKATHPDPEQRFDSMDSMRQALSTITQWRRKRWGWTIAGAAAITLAVITYFGYTNLMMRPPQGQVAGDPIAAIQRPARDSVSRDHDQVLADTATALDEFRAETISPVLPPDAVDSEVASQSERETTVMPATNEGKCELTIMVSPRTGAQVWLDDHRWNIGQTQSVDTGSHNLLIVGSGYPRLSRNIRIVEDSTFRIDIESIFAGTESAVCQISIFPHNREYSVLLTANGTLFELAQLPAGDFRLMEGGWRLQFDVRRHGRESSEMVDSIRVVAENHARAPIAGNTVTTDLKRLRPDGGNPHRFVVYWSRETAD